MLTFKIKDIFRITDRGYVLSGMVLNEGMILSEDKVLVTVSHECLILKIRGVSLEKEDGRFGILISFTDYDRLKSIELKDKEIKVIKIKERQKSASGPIEWTGDLLDDCTARWAGLMLRAEWTDENYWWWAVYDMTNDGVAIDSSNNYSSRFVGGESARRKAEEIAKSYLSVDG